MSLGSNSSNQLLALVQIAITEAASRVQAAVQAASIAATATEIAASYQAKATTESAGIRGLYQLSVAQAEVSAQRDVATIGGQFSVTAASIRGLYEVLTANAQGTYQLSAASVGAQAQRDVANTRGNYSVTVASIGASASISVASIGASAQTQVASIGANAEVAVAGIRGTYQLQAASVAASATVSSSVNQLTGVEYTANQETDRLNIALQFAEGKWDQIFPLIGPILAGLQNPDVGGATGLWDALIAALGPAPFVDASGVFTPSQIQMQLNQVYARNDAKANSLIQGSTIDLAGRGFGGNSPLLDILRFAYEAEGIEASALAGTELRVSTAKENSEAVFASQKALLDQYSASEQVFSRLNEYLFRLTGDLYSATLQMIGSLGRA